MKLLIEAGNLERDFKYLCELNARIIVSGMFDFGGENESFRIQFAFRS